MSCQIFPADPQGIEKTAGILLAGGIAAFPTETVYGLAADALEEAALKKIFRAKGREEDKPLLLLVAERGWLTGLVQEVSPLAERLMEAFWPGPLTLVLKASPRLSPLLTAGSGKIGVRLSSHPVARALALAAGRAITGTSANLSGQASASSAEEVRQAMGERLDAILDGGKTAGGPGSTVLDVSSPLPSILREGVISAQALRPFLNPG